METMPNNDALVVTFWTSLYEISTPKTQTLTWTAFTSTYSTHINAPRKDGVGGFGPYSLRPPDLTCFKHKDGLPRPGPHRCDSCIDEMTLLVFDVDKGTQQDIEACDEMLTADDVARHWYSTFSYEMGTKPALRLIILPTKPIQPFYYAQLRRSVLAHYKIPADPAQCSGKSHFYYAPSCPSWSTPFTDTSGSTPLDVHRFVPAMPPVARKVTAHLKDWQAATERATPLEQGYQRDWLTDKLDRLKASTTDAGKATILDRLLKGEPLGVHGERNTNTLIATGILAYALPQASLPDLQAWLEPSLLAMQSAGSKLTTDTTDRMFRTAMYARDAAKAKPEKTSGRMQALLDTTVFE